MKGSWAQQVDVKQWSHGFAVLPNSDVLRLLAAAAVALDITEVRQAAIRHRCRTPVVVAAAVVWTWCDHPCLVGGQVPCVL